MMSKSSPIYISDDSDDDQEEGPSDRDVMEVFSADDSTTPIDGNSRSENLSASSKLTLKIKSEKVDTTPTKLTMNASPKIKVILDQNRLKWLSGVIKLSGVPPVKSERELSSPSKGTVKVETEKVVKDNLPHYNQTQDDIPLPNSPQPSTSSSVNEEAKEEEEEDQKYIPGMSKTECLLSSPLSYKHFPDMHKSPKTPKKPKSNLQKALDSPRKAGVFGLSQKPLKQSCITEESFSPKKSMQTLTDKIEDNSHHTPPLHACQINGYGCVQSLEKPVLTMSESQLNILEGIKEEGLLGKYLDTVISFVSKYRKPPPQLCHSLITEVLLKSGTNYLATKSLWALKRIQGLHPCVPEKIEKNLLTWELIENIVERMELTGCNCKTSEGAQDQPCVKSSSAAKALTFLINVMESEVHRKQFCIRRTIAFRMLSLQRLSKRNVNQVLWWLRECITLSCKHSDSSGDTKVFDMSSSSLPSKKNQLIYALGLFQRLIQLSLSVSEDPDQCADILAGELLFTYNQLESLECRTIFLQSLHSHLLRSKFLKMYLETYCKDTEANRIVSNYTGVQRIVEVDFERLPQKRDVVEDSETRKCHEWHRSKEDCEEMSMVLSYSLQSYLFCHYKKLQSTPKRVTLTPGGVEEHSQPDNRRHLSISDVDQLCNMGDKVMILTCRLMSLCHEASVNKRTSQLLNLLSEMKLWDPW